MRRRSGGRRRRHDGVLLSISLRAGVRGGSHATVVGRAKRDHHDKARADNRRHPRLRKEATASRNSGVAAMMNKSARL
jgi:hypothetical protein